MAIASPLDTFLALASETSTRAHTDWRTALPVLCGSAVVLRELRAADAPALLTAFGSPDVTRLISPPPPTLDGFEKFAVWTQHQRQAGQSFALGVTLKDSDIVAGLFQVRALQPAFDIAEWGFALSTEHWGTGVFAEAAELVLEFVFDVVGVHRLEARAALKNGRGNGALHKLGAMQEGILQRSFLRNGVHLDQALWTILADAWRDSRMGRFNQLIH